VVPALARGAGAVAAAAGFQDDEFLAGDQGALGIDVHRDTQGHDVVDPGLHGAGGSEVVEAQAQENGVGGLDLVDQFGGQGEGLVLGGGA
jgi:hypothetical protein